MSSRTKKHSEDFSWKLGLRDLGIWYPSNMYDFADLAEQVSNINPKPRKALRAEPPPAPAKVATSARPLSPVEEAIVQILESLPPGKAIDGKGIMRKLRDKKISIGQPALARHIKKLKSRFNIVNTRGIGYHIAR